LKPINVNTFNIFSLFLNRGSRNGSLGISTGYILVATALFSVGTRNVSPLYNAQTGYGARSTSSPVDSGILPLVLKRPWREADHFPPCSSVVTRSRIVKLYLHFPKRVHGMVLNI
jgi:hypothetical protein